MDNGSTAVLQRFNVRVGPGIKAGKAYPREYLLYKTYQLLLLILNSLFQNLNQQDLNSRYCSQLTIR